MKFAIYSGAFLGGIIGAYLPGLWHAGEFSFWGIIGGFIGTLAGVWGGYKLGKYFDMD
jgi:hypothetical protein